VYQGMNFWGKHSIFVHALSHAMGCPVFPNSMFFRVTNEDTESAYVHSDRESGDFTCIVYLSDHADVTSGTGFYRHRNTGMTHMPSFADMAIDTPAFDQLKQQMVEGSEKDWELLDFVRGIYNRAVIFDAPRFHARYPKRGIGSNAEAGRMVWVCHFIVGALNG
jgi:hypothetical protein